MAPKCRAATVDDGPPLRTRATRRLAGDNTAWPANLFNLPDPEPRRKRRRRAVTPDPTPPPQPQVVGSPKNTPENAAKRARRDRSDDSGPTADDLLKQAQDRLAEAKRRKSAADTEKPVENPLAARMRARRANIYKDAPDPDETSEKVTAKPAEPEETEVNPLMKLMRARREQGHKDNPDPDDYRTANPDEQTDLTPFEIQAEGEIPATARLRSQKPPKVGGQAVGTLDRASTLWELSETDLLRAVMRSHPHNLQQYEDLTWSRAVPLGKGAYGVAHVYALRDTHGNIKDAEAVKDCLINDFQWNSVDFWRPHAHATDRRPAEVAALEDIRMQQTGLNPKFCTQLRHAGVHEKEEFYRIHMDYCSMGTLQSAIGPHLRAGVRISEPALWAVFYGLTNALLLLAHGAQDEANEPDDWTHGIVHRDLKPENIFLAENTSSTFTNFPVPVIGDFGLAVSTNDDDPLNPKSYNTDVGTPNWKPPELLKMYRIKSMKPWDEKLNEKTNIWGVGATIIRLMSRKVEPHHDYKGYYNDSRSDKDPNLRVHRHAKPHYSTELVELAEHCCKAAPHQRIGLRELKQAIDKYTGGTDAPEGKDLARGTRHSKQPGLFLRTSADKLLAGLAVLDGGRGAGPEDLDAREKLLLSS